MRVNSLQEKLRLEKMSHVLIIAIAISLPFAVATTLTNLFIVLLVAVWILQFKIKLNNLIFQSLILFYLLHAVGMVYSINTHQGFFELEKKISFVLFPLAASGISLTKKQFHYILFSFVASCFVAAGICLAYAAFKLAIYGTYGFTYEALTEVIGMQPIYLAMYTCFAIFVMIYLYFESGFWDGKFRTPLLLTGIVYFLFFLILLSARAEILAFCIIVVVGLAIYGYKTRRIVITGLIIGSTLTIIAASVYFVPQNRERFKEAINYKSQYSIDKQWGGRALRLLKWDCCLDIIRQNWILGVGTGDAQDELDVCYKQKNYSPLLYWENIRYNAHNQYLQSSVDLGILGLAAFLLCLATAIVVATKNKNYLFIAFIALFSMACITESMLERNKGIIFFTFFISIFVIYQRDKHKHSNNG